MLERLGQMATMERQPLSVAQGEEQLDVWRDLNVHLPRSSRLHSHFHLDYLLHLKEKNYLLFVYD